MTGMAFHFHPKTLQQNFVVRIGEGFGGAGLFFAPRRRWTPLSQNANLCAAVPSANMDQLLPWRRSCRGMAFEIGEGAPGAPCLMPPRPACMRSGGKLRRGSGSGANRAARLIRRAAFSRDARGDLKLGARGASSSRSARCPSGRGVMNPRPTFAAARCSGVC